MNRKFLAGFLAASLVLTAAPVVPGMEANADAEELSTGSQTGGGYLDLIGSSRAATQSAIIEETVTCTTFFSAHSKGFPVTEEGLEITFKSRSNGDKNWDAPIVVAYSGSGDAPEIGGADYVEYAVIRSDNFALDALAKPADFVFNADAGAIDWDTWKAANRSEEGANCKVSAVKKDGKIYIEFTNDSITSLSSFTPSSAGEVYIGITGENCVFGNTLPEVEQPDTPDTPDTPDIPVQPGDWPDVTELNCEAFWGVHTKGIAVGNDGVTVKFSNKTNGTNNWNTPIYVIYTGDEAKVGGVGYVEYGVMRSDAYGWDGAGKTGTMAWKAGTDPIDWAGWLATNQAGAEYEISAIRKEDTVFMKINAGGLITYVAIPVKEGKTAYLSLTGEQCKLENISKAGYVSFEVPDELASVAPEKPKPLAPYPVVLPTPEPVPTLPPADENSEGIEMDFAAFWSAHLPGVEITESGTALTYKNETHSSATGNYQVPFVVAYAGDEAKVNGAGYDEYAVIRADSYAWTTKGADANTGDGLAAWNNAGFNFQTNATADTWNSWVADNKAGLTGKIQAIKANGKIYIEFTNGSVRTLTSFAAPEGKKVYFSLAGEECKISNIKPAAYTSIDGINANPAETPAPSADPSASPDPAATAEPGSTATPGTTDPTDPGTNPGDKDPGTTDPGTDNPAENPSDGDDKKDNETKKTMKVSGITAKAGKKKVTGNLSVKGAKVTVKIGSKKAKNAKVNGKKFTFTASSKLKKGTKVTIKVTKSGYKAVTKTVKVK